MKLRISVLDDNGRFIWSLTYHGVKDLPRVEFDPPLLTDRPGQIAALQLDEAVGIERDYGTSQTGSGRGE